MSGTDRPQFERQRYWSGQTLRSKDLRDQLAIENELRWWHNRALHTAYGVVDGLEVQRLRDDRLEVSSGIAYDCFGRELLLPRAKDISVPADLSETCLLLIRYCGETPASDRLQSRTPVEAELVWKRTRHVSVRDGVPIAQTDADGKIAVSNMFQRPVSRALARPLIGSGSTIAGKTNWQHWRYPGLDLVGDGVDGVEVTIDTSASGFTDIPCYFAWLHGGLLSQPSFTPLRLLDIGPTARARSRVQGNSVRVAFDRITNSRPDHFVFSLVNLSDSQLLAFARRNLYVCWLGIQMASNEVNCDKT